MSTEGRGTLKLVIRKEMEGILCPRVGAGCGEVVASCYYKVQIPGEGFEGGCCEGGGGGGGTPRTPARGGGPAAGPVVGTRTSAP